ncbi:hypothetical protein [Paenibacillus sp. HW567]|uniref:hypothetical protein n=1 Tax=Paenibacillus sp. HW567 TaxID=1034769 RepID=UPI0003632148|nr:hypothetical protein [Paenibacillus sp. HW567]
MDFAILIGIGIYALRIAIPILVARVMWKKECPKWQIAIGFTLAIFIPLVGLIYLVISQFNSPRISRLK